MDYQKPKKDVQVVCEHKNGKKEIFWKTEGDVSMSVYEILKYARLLGFSSVKFNFGVRKEN